MNLKIHQCRVCTQIVKYFKPLETRTLYHSADCLLYCWMLHIEPFWWIKLAVVSRNKYNCVSIYTLLTLSFKGYINHALLILLYPRQHITIGGVIYFVIDLLIYFILSVIDFLIYFKSFRVKWYRLWLLSGGHESPPSNRFIFLKWIPI